MCSKTGSLPNGIVGNTNVAKFSNTTLGVKRMQLAHYNASLRSASAMATPQQQSTSDLLNEVQQAFLGAINSDDPKFRINTEYTSA